MILLTLYLSSHSLKARISRLTRAEGSAEGNAASTVLQQLGEVCVDVIPRTSLSRFKAGYPVHLLLDALISLFHRLSSGRTGTLLRQVERIVIVEDFTGPRFAARLVAPATAQRSLNELSFENNSAPLEVQLGVGNFLAESRFSPVEAVQNGHGIRAKLWSELDICAALLSADLWMAARSEEFHLATCWAVFGLSDCRVTRCTSEWAPFLCAHIGRSSWSPVLLLGEAHDVLLVPSDERLRHPSWRTVLAPCSPPPLHLGVPTRWPNCLLLRKFPGHGIARSEICKKYANSKWKAFRHLTDAMPLGGSIGMDSKTFCVTTLDDDAPMICLFEQGFPIQKLLDIRAYIRLITEGQAMRVYCALQELPGTLDIQTGRHLIMAGASAAPAIHANILNMDVSSVAVDREEDVISLAIIKGATAWAACAGLRSDQDNRCMRPILAPDTVEACDGDFHQLYLGLFEEYKRLAKALPVLLEQLTRKSQPEPITSPMHEKPLMDMPSRSPCSMR